MSMLAILALAASSTATFPHCSWDRPGVNPFMGDVVAAVDRYQDIPAATRAKLKTRMQARQYDEFALITRDKIEGQASYAPEIRDMHFGQGQVCRTVTRAKWTDAHRERGLVYCEDGHCLIVPTVCRNLSRVTRLPKPLAGAAQEPAPLAKAADEPLLFEAPAAGGTPAPTFVQALQSPIPTPVPPAVSPTVTPSFLSPPGGVPPLAPTVTPQLLPPAPPLPAIPEPATWALMALGLATVLARKRRLRED